MAGPKKEAKNGSRARKNDAARFLKQQHRDIKTILARRGEEAAGKELLRSLAAAWVPHTMLEEDILYPMVSEAGANTPAFDEAQVKRDIVKILFANAMAGETDPSPAIMTVIATMVEELIKVEEKPQSGLIALAAAAIDMTELLARLEERNTEFQHHAENNLRLPGPRLLRVEGIGETDDSQENDTMARQGNMRERDEDGRFTSDDDDRGGGRGSRGSNNRDRDENGRFMSEDDNRSGSRGSRNGDDDRGGGRGSRGSNNRDRDENGRFMSDDDNRSGSRGSRSGGNDRERDENGRFMSDDDDRGGRSGSGGRQGGRGGWFGDSEGHSEAARRGRNESSGRGSQSRSDDDDDDRRGSRGGRGGWFGDSEGHSEAARRGRDDRDDDSRSGGRNGGSGNRSRSRDDDDDDGRRGGRGGWFGDSRGHSEAAHRGWEDREDSRSSGRSQGSGNRSRSRDDDDDDRGGERGRRDHGGWFGDSEGHSEAARRGWEERDGGSRSGGRNESSGSRSRSRDDDEDRRGSGSNRGWSGDPEGHAEAARRGWEHRR